MNNDDITVWFTLFNNEYENVTSNYVECSWGDMNKTYLSEHVIVEKKEQVLLFNGWRFKGKGRLMENTDKARLLFFDYDGGAMPEDVVKLFDGYEYTFYTSHNHVIKGDRFRIVMPTKTAFTMEEYKARTDRLKQMAGDIDPASFSGTQPFRLPSCPKEMIEYSILHRSRGQLFDLHAIPPVPKNKPNLNQRDDDPDVDLDELFNQLCCLDLTGQYHDWMKIGCAMHRAGYTKEDFYQFTSMVKPTHAKDNEIDRKWKSFENYKGDPSIGTLFHYLRKKT